MTRRNNYFELAEEQKNLGGQITERMKRIAKIFKEVEKRESAETEKLKSQLKIAKAQEMEAQLNFQQTLLNAGIEVNNALAQVQTYRIKGDLYDNQVEVLGRAVKSTSLLMRHGSNTYLEVLTAQQSLLSAQLTQLSNRYNETIATVNLYQALGVGK